MESTPKPDKISEYHLGKKYEMGIGTKKDIQKAIKYYTITKNNNMTDYRFYASFRLGKLYYYGTDVPQSYEKAFDFFTFAEDGFDEIECKKKYITWYYLGNLYFHGFTKSGKIGERFAKNYNMASYYYYEIMKEDELVTITNEKCYKENNLLCNVGYIIQSGHTSNYYDYSEDSTYVVAYTYYETSIKCGEFAGFKHVYDMIDKGIMISLKSYKDYAIQRCKDKLFCYKIKPTVEKHLIPVLTDIVLQYTTYNYTA